MSWGSRGNGGVRTEEINPFLVPAAHRVPQARVLSQSQQLLPPGYSRHSTPLKTGAIPLKTGGVGVSAVSARHVPARVFSGIAEKVHAQTNSSYAFGLLPDKRRVRA